MCKCTETFICEHCLDSIHETEDTLTILKRRYEDEKAIFDQCLKTETSGEEDPEFLKIQGERVNEAFQLVKTFERLFENVT